MRANERGNVLFYILIAVVLLGALTYAVSHSGSLTGTDKISEDKARLYATEVIGLGNDIGNAISQLRLRGCTLEQISFEQSYLAGYTNANSPADRTCHVFEKAGGGVQYRLPDSQWMDMSKFTFPVFSELFFPSAWCVYNVGTNSATLCESNGDEELMFLLMYLNAEVCTQINNLLSVTNPSGNPPQNIQDSWAGSSITKYTGSFAGVQHIGGNGFNGDEGKLSGCFEETSAPMANTYHYYKVFTAR